jgi:hypothetical protein
MDLNTCTNNVISLLPLNNGQYITQMLLSQLIFATFINNHTYLAFSNGKVIDFISRSNYDKFIEQANTITNNNIVNNFIIKNESIVSNSIVNEIILFTNDYILLRNFTKINIPTGSIKNILLKSKKYIKLTEIVYIVDDYITKIKSVSLSNGLLIRFQGINVQTEYTLDNINNIYDSISLYDNFILIDRTLTLNIMYMNEIYEFKNVLLDHKYYCEIITKDNTIEFESYNYKKVIERLNKAFTIYRTYTKFKKSML